MAAAQTAAPGAKDPALATTLEHLAAAAETLHTALPNFECAEAVSSRRMRGGKEKWAVHFTATLRVHRDGRGEPEESFTPLTLEGKTNPKPKFKMPIYVEGGFANALDAVFAQEAGVLRVHAGAGADRLCRPAARGLRTGAGTSKAWPVFALLDADGEVRHIERTVPDETARKYRIAPFAAIDLAPVELNGRVFRLSSHLTSTWPSGDDDDRFEAEYTGCRLFTANVTLLPGSSVVSEDAPAPPAPK